MVNVVVHIITHCDRRKMGDPARDRPDNVEPERKRSKPAQCMCTHSSCSRSLEGFTDRQKLKCHMDTQHAEPCKTCTLCSPVVDLATCHHCGHGSGGGAGGGSGIPSGGGGGGGGDGQARGGLDLLARAAQEGEAVTTDITQSSPPTRRYCVGGWYVHNYSIIYWKGGYLER
jgi:hypothetical protein